MGIAGMLLLLFTALAAELWRRRKGIQKGKYFLDGLEIWAREHFSAVRKAEARQKAQLALLNEEEEKFSLRKSFRLVWYSLFAGCFLLTVLEISGGREQVTELPRTEFGEGERIYELEVEGLTDGKEALEIIVGGREPSEEELLVLFDEIAAKLRTEILNGNPSLENVSEDLYFPEKLTGGIRAEWYPQDPERISFLGEVDTEGIAEDGVITVLNVTLKYREQAKTYQIPVRVIPPKLTEKEEKRSALEKEILRREAEDPSGEAVVLPGELDGRTLVYTEIQESLLLPFSLLILSAALLTLYLPVQKLNQRLKKREKALLSGYAAMVSKLSVLTGAGLSLRGAWSSMAAEYQEKYRKGVSEKDYVYEEICIMVNQMEQGIGEARVYGAFGRRCGLYPYLRLSNILEQNLKKGTRGLQGMLRQEVQNALEERKNLARKMGEEAGTKLLAPMFLMLGIVLVIVAVPAFLSF